jgi:hypothetical protein
MEAGNESIQNLIHAKVLAHVSDLPQKLRASAIIIMFAQCQEILLTAYWVRKDVPRSASECSLLSLRIPI